MADADNLPAVAHARTAPAIGFSEMERMAESFARSGLFGAKTRDQALALLMLGQAEGMHPALAVQEFDIIEGKPARKAERIQARFQLSGGKIEWLELTDTIAKATFSHPQGATVTIDWTIERARAIKYRTKEGTKSLAEKDNWRNYPRAMLRARCIAEGCRACFPAYALVTFSTEEAMDGGTLTSEPINDDGIDVNAAITDEQAKTILDKIAATSADIERFCRYLGVECVPDIRQGDFQRALDALDAKAKAKQEEIAQ